MFWKGLVLALCVVAVFAQDFQVTEESKEQAKNVLKAQCTKVNAEDKAEGAVKSVQDFADCVKGLFNATQLKEEIEDAKPKGALDEVFKKYCAKSPQLKTCIHTVLDGVSPCLEKDHQNLISSAKNGTDQLIDFVCFKDGDRIALFIAEQGPECFRDQSNAIRDCVTRMQTAVPNQEAAKALTLKEKCGKFDILSTCIVSALEQCDTPTPANMAESLFKFVRKGSPCNAELPLLNN